MKKIVSFLLIITLLLCNGISVLAEEIPTPPADQISNNPDCASIELFFPINHSGITLPNAGEDGLGIIYTQASISPYGSGSVIISVTTTANMLCMNIGGYAIIERWNNNTWSSYYTISFWSHNTSTYTATYNVAVESGYYYRVRSIHIADSEHSSVSVYAITKSIIVN